MPWVSQAQRRWGNSPSGHRALGNAGVAEWNSASKGQQPPEKTPEKKKPDLSTMRKPLNG